MRRSALLIIAVLAGSPAWGASGTGHVALEGTTPAPQHPAKVPPQAVTGRPTPVRSGKKAMGVRPRAGLPRSRLMRPAARRFTLAGARRFRPSRIVGGRGLASRRQAVAGGFDEQAMDPEKHDDGPTGEVDVERQTRNESLLRQLRPLEGERPILVLGAPKGGGLFDLWLVVATHRGLIAKQP